MIESTKRIAGLLLFSAALFIAGDAGALRRAVLTNTDDAVFLTLRDASLRDDGATAESLAARLPNYAIPSYVDYYRLRPALHRVATGEIQRFLQRYEGTAIGDRLRNDWLLELGRQRDWATFDQQYPLFQLNDDLQLKCYALLSRASKGEAVANDARGLLTFAQNYGEACPALIAALMQSGQFSSDDVWAQMRLAAEAGSSTLTRRISAATSLSEQTALQAVEKPALVLARGAGNNRDTHQLFIVALGRVAKSNPPQATEALLNNAAQLTPTELALGWAQIALQASIKLLPNALDYWRKAGAAPLSYDGYQWRVRSALRAGDWQLVKSGIDAMPAELRKDPTWIYWVGRALKNDGKLDAARALFQSIADQTHFYGQLALEELGQQISVPPGAETLSADEIAPMANVAGFQRAIKFFELNLRLEGYREWNWELRKMSERQLLAAAEFARQNNLLDRMVNTSDRTRVEVDFTQRYPAPYRDIMQINTTTLGLDPAWVYGLIRQESRFIMNARSSVGASGLMQLMPATASFVARKIGLDGFGQHRVNDIQTNITLGTNYLNMVLNDLDGSQTLATAAYNAGPGRPRAWRSTLPRAVEGAIFAESIPFTETRGYVKNVLSNATWYAALFENRPQSLKARLGMVAPKGFVASDLP